MCINMQSIERPLFRDNGRHPREPSHESEKRQKLEIVGGATHRHVAIRVHMYIKVALTGLATRPLASADMLCLIRNQPPEPVNKEASQDRRAVH